MDTVQFAARSSDRAFLLLFQRVRTGASDGKHRAILAAFGGMCGLLLYVAVTLKNAGGSLTKRSAAAKVTRS
jgi:threonine/homoserine/homoserine lactone efflux protein